ncbi:MAG TPA: response regulator transcription factor [Candidatus Limiplasma sp.]|jgi:DNA-binding NarL/FixJ family response regulator|nr:response regulator transcription factor [Candidatus Limiplasma sp.]HPR79208.1 response regulator transcription factor [Candidatus Limiplasma sp.]
MINVLIAEDMPALLRKYKRELDKESDIHVVAAVQSGYEAVMQSALLHPDIVLMDIEMETRTAGLEASTQILNQLPGVKIVILTVYEDDESVFKAFQLGVSDYVLKNSDHNELVACIRDAYFGRSPIRPVIAEKIRREFQRVKTSEQSLLYYLQIVSQLTPAELDILTLLHKGYSRQAICDLRCIVPSTVKTHIHNVLRKFNMDTAAEVIGQLDALHIFEYLTHRDDGHTDEPPRA